MIFTSNGLDTYASVIILLSEVYRVDVHCANNPWAFEHILLWMAIVLFCVLMLLTTLEMN